jgi:hypothetical protein
MVERRQNNWTLLLRKENDVPNLKSILRMWLPFALVMSAGIRPAKTGAVCKVLCHNIK